MDERRAKRLEKRYRNIENGIIAAYRKNPKAFLMSFYKRKARSESGPMVYGAILVLIIGFAWEIASKLILTGLDFSQFAEAAAAVEMLVRGFGIIVIFALLVILGTLFYCNRRLREEVMIEEHILKDHGILDRTRNARRVR